jgi:hypothetical protein
MGPARRIFRHFDTAAQANLARPPIYQTLTKVAPSSMTDFAGVLAVLGVI